MPKYSLPGPKSQHYLEMSETYEPRCMSQQAPLVWESAEGAIVRDVDGNEYIDITSGVLVTNVGHSHPKHVAAIREQAGRLLNPYDFPTPQRVQLARRLVEITPDNLDKAFLLTTGSEATEAAMRASKRCTGRHEIISFYGAFHGRTYGAMSMAGKMGTKRQFGPLMPGCIYAPYPYCFRCWFGKQPDACDLFCIEFLDTVLEAESAGDVAALIVEPYQGAAGFIFPPDGYLTRLEAWARDKDVIFILDEVQSSFGRTGKFFALEWEGLRPNLLCLGKGIGSGVPTAALMAESRIMDSLGWGEMSSTTGGNPLSCAAALAVLDIMEHENLVEKARRVGQYMLRRFQGMAEKYEMLGDARGKGLVMGLEFVEDKQSLAPAPELTRDIVRSMCEHGVVCGCLGWHGNVIRVAPPLVITDEHAEQVCDTFDAVLSQHR